MDHTTVPPDAVTGQLERMLASGVFRSATRSTRLLRFLVEETLEGRGDRLKDYTLGAEALGRGQDFDPRTDPIARVEASRLRAKLDLYYATEGASDPVLITLPKGGYVPQFEHREPPAEPLHPRLSRRVAMTLAAVLSSALFAAWLAWQPTSPALHEMHLEVSTPATTDPVSLAIAPDGQSIAFVANAGDTPRLWLRRMGSSSATEPLSGTEHASLPFWSWDGRSLGFFADSQLKRIDLDTKRVQVLASALVPAGGTWGPDDTILFPIVPDSPIFGVPADGSRPPVQVTRLDAGHTGHRAPHVLPDGRHFLFSVTGTAGQRGIYVGDVENGTVQRLLDADASPVFVAPRTLMYVDNATLFAHEFDPTRRQLVGRPHVVAEHMAVMPGVAVAALAVSRAGSILYRTESGGRRQLVWFDRRGNPIANVGSPEERGPLYASMEARGRRLLVQRARDGNTDIWAIDPGRPAWSPVTTDPVADIAPVWSPHGDGFVFSSLHTGVFDLYRWRLNGAGREQGDLLLATDQPKQATDWSRDGRYLLYRSLDPVRDWDILALPIDEHGRPGDPIEVVRTDTEDRDGQFSPNGRWVAYQSNVSGRFEIYVRPFLRPGEPTPVSLTGGVQVRWSHDGTELFYLTLDGRLMAVPIAEHADGHDLTIGDAHLLFAAPVGAVQNVSLHHYIVSRDGRFLMDTVIEDQPSPIAVILNWQTRRAE